MDPSLYKMETFAPHLNTAFEADGGHGACIRLLLAEVTAGPSNARTLQFSLIFRGPAEPRLPQQTICLRHPELGDMNFFLVPIANDESGMVYEAAFNRFVADPPAKK